MACPLPIFDEIEYLQEQRGAKLAKAKPHRMAMPKHLNESDVLDDYRIIVDFLLGHDGSLDTFNAYRREVDRFILWAWFERKACLPELTRSDIESYLSFIANPPLSWRGVDRKKRFVSAMGLREPNPEWRPFVSSISKADRKRGVLVDERGWVQSPATLGATFRILRTFFTFLVDEDHVTRNVVAKITSKSKKAESKQGSVEIKRLTKTQTHAVFQAIEAMREGLDPSQYERILFMVSCLLSMYLRISEVASSGKRMPTHGSFFYKIHEEGDVQVKTWWFSVIGKGNKQRKIPVSDDLLKSLRRYRESQGLSPLPAIGEKLPLFLKERGPGGLTSARHVRDLLQNVFDRAVIIFREQGKDDEADGLMACTVHWLRHTGISEEVTVMPLAHVREKAGHSDISTTGIYVNNDDVELHKSASNSSVLDRLR